MTCRSTWKRFEQQVARDQGTQRTPLSGSSSRHTGADTLHPRIYSEAKYRKRWAIWTLFEAVKVQAAKEGKIPCLFLKERGKKGYLMCFHSNDWFELVRQYQVCGGLKQGE